MNQNNVRTAKLKLCAALIRAGLMLDAPVSLRYQSASDIDEVEALIGQKLRSEDKEETADPKNVMLLLPSQLPVSNELVDLVIRFQEFLVTNTMNARRQPQNKDVKDQDHGISYGIGIAKFRRADPNTVLAVRVFSRRSLKNANAIKTKWSDDFGKALGVDVLITRMKEPSLLARNATRYRVKNRPVTIGSGISSADRCTGSVTLVVAPNPQTSLTIHNLDPEKRYLLSAGHVFLSSGMGSNVYQPSLEFERQAEVVGKVVHVEAPTKHGEHTAADFSLTESVGGVFVNAWGREATPVKDLATPNDVDIGQTVHKSGGAGTGEGTAEVVGIEIDADFRGDGKKFRYLDQLEIGSLETLSEPGDSGALICVSGKALAMIVGGSQRRGEDEPLKSISYATFLSPIIIKHSLKIVY